jgi:ubiquinone/menaquinone biosynthesis C-methylase UbiE
MSSKLGKNEMSGKHEGHLDEVYAAKDTKSLAAAYDAWSETYDIEMTQAGYRHPAICLALLARHLPRDSQPLLDAGAGTGLIGELLSIMGYPHVEALDISTGMLSVARKKNCYAAFHNLALGADLPFKTETFAGIISAGVFTTGHVGTEGLGELIRICRKGGVIVLTVKGSIWENSFQSYTDELTKSGLITILEITDPYKSVPGGDITKPGYGLVLRVN